MPFIISLHETSFLELLGGLVLITLLTSHSCFFLLLFIILKMVNGFLRFPSSVPLWYSVWTLFLSLFFSILLNFFFFLFLPFLVLPLKLRVCLRAPNVKFWMLKGTRLFHAYRNCSFTVVSLHLVSAFVQYKPPVSSFQVVLFSSSSLLPSVFSQTLTESKTVDCWWFV